MIQSERHETLSDGTIRVHVATSQRVAAAGLVAMRDVQALQDPRVTSIAQYGFYDLRTGPEAAATSL